MMLAPENRHKGCGTKTLKGKERYEYPNDSGEHQHYWLRCHC